MTRRHLHLADASDTRDVLELRTVPEPGDHTDEWSQGWRACREILEQEWATWYARGLAARPMESQRLDVAMAATAAFIVGFVVAAALTSH